MTRARVVVLLACGVGVVGLVAIERSPRAEPPAEPEPEGPSPSIVRTGMDSRVERVVLGRRFVVEVTAGESVASAALTDVFEHLGVLDRQLAAFRPGSDVWTIDARAGQGPTVVEADAARLLARARELRERTRGRYEPAMGAVARLWPFGRPEQPLPRRDAIADALAHVDSGPRVSGRQAWLEDPAARLSLGGLDASFAIQVVGERLGARGIDRFVVRTGDELLVRGAGGGAIRSIVIPNPRWPDRAVDRFTVAGGAVARLDDTRGALVRDGVVLPPVLDPATGAPARGARSVTVVGPDPMLARAYAIAVFVMGAERGPAWVEAREGIAATIIAPDGRVIRTSGWGRLTHPSPERPSPVASPSADPGPSGGPRSPAEPPPAARAPGAATREGLVPVAGFRLDRTEVTNADYARFLAAQRAAPHAHCHPAEPPGYDHTPRYHRRWRPALLRSAPAGALAPFGDDTFRAPDRPVVGVSFWDAFAFARHNGARLPTRAELTRACRGPDGRRWPFGATWMRRAVNAGGERDGERDGHVYAAPARSFEAGASADGVLHLAGNVAEWTEDAWVVGGSSRSNASQVACGAGRRRERSFRAFDVGFRCAADGAP